MLDYLLEEPCDAPDPIVYCKACDDEAFINSDCKIQCLQCEKLFDFPERDFELYEECEYGY